MKKDNFDIFDYIWSFSKKDDSSSKLNNHIFELTWSKLVLTYIIGGTIGTVWEICLHLYNHHEFEFRNGSFFTPFNPVYGFGLCAIILFLHKLRSSKQIFAVGAVVGGVAEYSLSFLQEKLLGSKSWDYSNRFLNINGRTTIPYCIFWGFGCLVIIKIVYPFIFKRLAKISKAKMNVIGAILITIIILDLFTTAGGLLRYNLRSQGKDAITFLGTFFDTFFGDKRVELFFPNMKLT